MCANIRTGGVPGDVTQGVPAAQAGINRVSHQRNDPDLCTTDPEGVGSKHRLIEGVIMAVYKVVELVGTSPTSWEEAAKSAVAAAASSLRDLRIAEVSDLDMQIDDGNVVAYRAKVKVSFKHEAGG